MCYPPYYIGDEDGDHLYYSSPLLEHKDKCAYNKDNKDEYIPAWSIAALLGVLPDYTLQTNTDGAVFVVCEGKKPMISDAYNNPVDACVAMVELLHELNLL